MQVAAFTGCLLLVFFGLGCASSMALQIGKGSAGEALSIPFQQTARMVREHGDELTDGDREAISAVLDYDNLGELYQPQTSDPVKGAFGHRATTEELMRYFAAWAGMGLRHLLAYFEATTLGAYDYWHPFHQFKGKPVFWTDSDNVGRLAPELKEIHFFMGDSTVQHVDDILNAVRFATPLGILFAPEAYIWAYLFAAGYLWSRKGAERRKSWVMLPLLPVFLVCFASPVNGYFRYAFPLVGSLSLVAALLVARDHDRGHGPIFKLGLYASAVQAAGEQDSEREIECDTGEAFFLRGEK